MSDHDPDHQLTLAFQRVFGTHDGERTKDQLLVLARLRHLARPSKVHFTPTESDRDLAFRQGRLELWLEIDNRVATRPQTVAELLGGGTTTVEE